MNEADAEFAWFPAASPSIRESLAAIEARDAELREPEPPEAGA